MARPNVLFMVHGIGEHRGGWCQLPKAKLREAALNYTCFTNRPDPLEYDFEIVEIRCDDIFDTILQRFSNLTKQFQKVEPALMPAALDKIINILNKPECIASCYAGDVLLYQLKLVSTTVLLRVMRRITETVSQIGRVVDGQVVKYGILGHSMGTTVVHDALQLLATQPLLSNAAMLQELAQAIPELASDYVQQFGNNPFSDVNFQFDAVYMVSNTSRLLHTTDAGPYESLVRPFNLQNTRAVCRSFYNIEHRWDPVAKFKQFRLADAWGGHTEGAIQVDVEHVYETNIHALDHYLLNPRVHGVIFRQMAASFKEKDLKQAQALVDNNTFKRWGPDFDLDVKRQALMNQLQARVQEALGSSNVERLHALLMELKK